MTSGCHFIKIYEHFRFYFPVSVFRDLEKAKGLKLAHLNVRSLINKVDKLRLLLDNSDIDVFSVSETWLTPHLQTDLVTLQGFQAHRLDKGPKGKKRGGGLITQ